MKELVQQLFRGGVTVPAEVRRRLPERVLAAALTDEGVWLVGGRDALHVVSADGAPVTPLPWQRVLRADYDGESRTLTVEEVRDYGQPVAIASYAIHDAALLLQLVRERVTASIVHQRRVEVGKRRGLTVIGRRPPAGGEVLWAFQLDPGVDPDAPEVRAASQAALRDAQEALGHR